MSIYCLNTLYNLELQGKKSTVNQDLRQHTDPYTFSELP